METTTATTVAKINNVNIIAIEDGVKRVAIRPVCEALGVDPDWQNSKIKDDEILGQLHKTSYVVAADGKTREMATIPFKWIFGWLFSINPKNVRSEAKESLVRYKKQCYDALYNHFAELDEYLYYRTDLVEAKIDNLERLRNNFKDAKYMLEKAKNELERARSITFDTWRASKSQMIMQFPDDTPADIDESYITIDEITEL